MTDWLDGLEPEGREQWDDFVDHFRKEAVEMIAGSGAAINLVPSDGKGDVKYWAELGCMIMLDKPIIAIVQPGAAVPPKLEKVADAVVYADLDTEEGRESVSQALSKVVGT